MRRVFAACSYSWQGLASAFSHEEAFRLEVVAALVFIPVALLLDLSAAAKAVMVASVLLVLIIELVNSAIEAAVDRVSLDRHHLAKRAKDIGSAAVFLALVNAGLVWAIVLWDRYLG